jgi:cell division protein FtsN
VSLKKWALCLLLANALYLSYALGWIGLMTGADSAQREPARLQKQVNAQAITVTPIGVTELSVTKTTPAESACGSVESVTPAAERWVVYMGPYDNKTLLEKKQAELSRLTVKSTPISKPSLKLGLSLGEFDSEANAKAALEELKTKGVKSATFLLWSSNPAAENLATKACSQAD